MWYHSMPTLEVVVMSEKTEQVKAYVTPAEKRQLKEWAAETDQSLSSLVRQAVLEYTDRDRAARIEDKLDRVLNSLDDGDTHTQTRPDNAGMQGSQTVERTREIADRIYDNQPAIMGESDVERAITDIAGGDPRTVKKYKDELRERSLLYRHPNDELGKWYTERSPWLADLAEYVQQFRSPLGKLTAELQQYGLSVADMRDENDTIEQLVTQ